MAGGGGGAHTIFKGLSFPAGSDILELNVREIEN